MTRYIVDASVVAEYLIGGTYTQNAANLFQGALNGDEFIVPELCFAECTNVIWKMVRFQGMPLSIANATLRNLKALPLKQSAIKSLLSSALTIGLKHQIAVYDALYIALAVRGGSSLVTIDQKQATAAAQEQVIVRPVSDFTE